MTVLVDTNVLIDVITSDATWSVRSQAALDAAALVGDVVINDVIYAELSVRYDLQADLDDVLDATGIDVMPMPRRALFLAGKAFLAYRGRGGARNSPLPDFFIGAHAAVLDWPLLTRDHSRYASYFPTITLLGV